MTETYYKGVRPDGRDFYSGTVQWTPEKTKARKGRVVKHPTSRTAELGDFTTFLSVSTDPTNLPGSLWPMRLLEVEPIGDVLRVDACKRGGVAFRVVREVDPALHFGPMGEHVVALIERAGRLTAGEARDLHAAWAAARNAARNAARAAARNAAGAAAGDAARAAARAAARDAARNAAGDAAWAAAWDASGDAAWAAAWAAAWDAAWAAARNAAWAAVARDLIGQHGFTLSHYDTLTGPWRKVIGPVHPDDEDLR